MHYFKAPMREAAGLGSSGIIPGIFNVVRNPAFWHNLDSENGLCEAVIFH